MVLTDKDCSELAGISAVFPDAVSLLCQFHVVCAIDTRFAKARLEPNEREEIYLSFQRALHAHTEDGIDIEEVYLCSLGLNEYYFSMYFSLVVLLYNNLTNSADIDNLGEYFKNHWFNCRAVWCDFYRSTLFTKGNNTTNRLER